MEPVGARAERQRAEPDQEQEHGLWNQQVSEDDGNAMNCISGSQLHIQYRIYVTLLDSIAVQLNMVNIC